MMELCNHFILLFYTCLLLSPGYIVAGSSPHHNRRRHHHHLEKLFVFGDSYADTGNVRKSLGNSWKEPYGITFPGKPAGRFSDGRILTDYFAKFFGLKSPVAYIWMKFGGKKLQNGMNFAFGGSGVFDTYNNLPNMSIQIDYFEKLISDSVYTKRDLNSSVVLVSLAGNDYGAYLAKGGSVKDLPSFIPLVINQTSLVLKRLRDLGANKIVVTSLEPLGCLPQVTRLSSFQQCNITQNLAVGYHNLLLQQAVSKLNNETKASKVFILDLYSSFTTVLEQNGDDQDGNTKFESPLKPCCVGISSAYSCGSVDGKGNKMYTVCSDPKSAFFWDAAHPTQQGWNAVYSNLKPSLEQVFRI